MQHPTVPSKIGPLDAHKNSNTNMGSAINHVTGVPPASQCIRRDYSDQSSMTLYIDLNRTGVTDMRYERMTDSEVTESLSPRWWCMPSSLEAA